MSISFTMLVLCLSILLQTTCSQNPKDSLPFLLSTDCFILNIASSSHRYWSEFLHPNEIEETTKFNLVKEKVHVTWLNYKASLFDFLITTTEASDESFEINLQHKYFRFSKMHFRMPCVVLLLFTRYASESVTAISNSGFGTSRYAMAFQFVGKSMTDDSMIKLLQQNHLYLDSNVKFTVPLFFFCNCKHHGIKMFTENTRYAILTLTNSYEFESLKEISLKFIQSCKSDWCYVFPDGLVWNHSPKCGPTSDNISNRRLFYKDLYKCRHTDQLMIPIVLRYINISVSQFELKGSNQVISSWLFNIFTGDTWSPSGFPLSFTELRYILNVGITFEHSFTAYLHIDEISNLYFGILTVFKPSVWLCFLASVMLVGWIYGNIWFGMDLLWPIFGISCKLNHLRSVVCVYYVSVLLVALSYSSNLTSDLMAISNIPDVDELISKGYKLIFMRGFHKNQTPKVAHSLFVKKNDLGLRK